MAFSWASRSLVPSTRVKLLASSWWVLVMRDSRVDQTSVQKAIQINCRTLDIYVLQSINICPSFNSETLLSLQTIQPKPTLTNPTLLPLLSITSVYFLANLDLWLFFAMERISQQSFYKQRMTDRRTWTAEQDEIILHLIHQHGTAQWTTIAIEMRELVAHTRSSKQIRERWYNQLSPNIMRSPWTEDEENTLFLKHSKHGNRWKEIAKTLPGRTDNSVKNHFYSTVRRALRRLDKHFGFRDSTKKMRGLKPAALTLLFQTARTLPDYAQMMDLLLQFARWKPSKSNIEPLVQNGRELYESILSMISTFNQTYRRGPRAEQVKAEVKEEEVCKREDNYSTLSDGQASDDSQISNYFGSIVAETRSWFNVNDREWGAKVPQEQQLRMICDEDHFQ